MAPSGAVTAVRNPLAGARAAAASPLTQHVARAYLVRLSLSRDASPLIHCADLPSVTVEEFGSTLLLIRSRHPYPMIDAMLARDIADSVVAAGLYGPPAGDLQDALAIKMAGAAYLAAAQPTDPRCSARLSHLGYAAFKRADGDSRHILSTLLSDTGADQPPLSDVASQLLATTDLLPSHWQTRVKLLALKLPPIVDGEGPDAAADIAAMYTLSRFQAETAALHREVVQRLVEKAIELAVYWSAR